MPNIDGLSTNGAILTTIKATYGDSGPPVFRFERYPKVLIAGIILGGNVNDGQRKPVNQFTIIHLIGHDPCRSDPEMISHVIIKKFLIFEN
ncbi:31842_t:CDS:2, partial [Gigaspora margarita]